jgi:hypothetical protein
MKSDTRVLSKRFEGCLVPLNAQPSLPGCHKSPAQPLLDMTMFPHVRKSTHKCPTKKLTHHTAYKNNTDRFRASEPRKIQYLHDNGKSRHVAASTSVFPRRVGSTFPSKQSPRRKPPSHPTPTQALDLNITQRASNACLIIIHPSPIPALT